MKAKSGGESEVQCKLCRRNAEHDGELCRYHVSAMDALKKGYKLWSDAYSGISWRDYLNRVKALEDVGIWIKDVIDWEGLREP